MSYRIADKGADRPRTAGGQRVDKLARKLRPGPVFMGVSCIRRPLTCPLTMGCFCGVNAVFLQKMAFSCTKNDLMLTKEAFLVMGFYGCPCGGFSSYF